MDHSLASEVCDERGPSERCLADELEGLHDKERDHVTVTWRLLCPNAAGGSSRLRPTPSFFATVTILAVFALFRLCLLIDDLHCSLAIYAGLQLVQHVPKNDNSYLSNLTPTPFVFPLAFIVHIASSSPSIMARMQKTSDNGDKRKESRRELRRLVRELQRQNQELQGTPDYICLHFPLPFMLDLPIANRASSAGPAG